MENSLTQDPVVFKKGTVTGWTQKLQDGFDEMRKNKRKQDHPSRAEQDTEKQDMVIDRARCKAAADKIHKSIAAYRVQEFRRVITAHTITITIAEQENNRLRRQVQEQQEEIAKKDEMIKGFLILQQK